MLLQLLLISSHFTINVLGALVFFILGILEIISWSLAKEIKTQLIRGLGLFIFAIVAATHAINFDAPTIVFGLQLAKVIALSLILASMYAEPILHPPPKKKLALIIPFGLITFSIIPLSAILLLLISLVYLRRATEGYDKQLIPAFRGFLFLSLSEFTNIAFSASNSPIVFWSNLLREFGPIWILSHSLELAGMISLGLWSWRYLRFKADVQLFITTFASSLVIFIATTFSFTFHLLRNLEADALGHLKTDVSVLQYALNSLESEALANARVIAENSDFTQSFLSEDTNALFDSSLQFMLSQQTDFLNITSAQGKVIMRAEDKERVGDSLAGDIVVRSALSGTAQTTVTSNQGIVSPEIEVRAAAPIIDKTADEDNQIVGVVVTGFKVDSVFVDGIKDVTGLDVTVFGGNTRAATTFVAPDGKSRFLGTTESNQKILDQVVNKAEVFIGPAKVLNQAYYTAYSPLLTKDEEVIGMLSVGTPQTRLFETAENSIRLTFLGSILLMVLAIPPNYFLARYIKDNLDV